MKRRVEAMMVGRRRGLAAAAAVLAAADLWLGAGGCGHLDPIPSNVCGNGVVEPDNGEDCDGEHGCGKPNTPHECRFECATTADCPARRGFGCGVDGVCRAPSGTFTALGRESTASTVDFFTGDTNADGCHEVVRTTLHGTTITALASKQPGLCAASEQSLPLRPLPPDVTLQYPSPFLAELTGNTRPELVIPNGALVAATQGGSQNGGHVNELNGGLFVNTSDTNPSSPLTPELYTSGEQFPETSVRILKASAGGKDHLLLFLSAIAMTSATPPARKCPADPGPPATLSGTMRVAALDSAASRSRTLLGSLPGTVGDIAAVQAGDLNGDGCDEVVVAMSGTDALQVFTTCDAQKKLAFSPYNTASIKLDGGVRVRSFNSSLAITRVDADAYPDVLVLTDDCQVHVAYGWPNGQFGSAPPGSGTADGKTGVLTMTDPMITQMLNNTDAIFVVGSFDHNHPGQSQVAAVACPGGQPFSSDVCLKSPGDCEAVVVDIDRDSYDDIITTQGQQLGLVVGRADPNGGFHQSTLDTECPPHHLTTGDFDDDGVADVAFLDQISTVDRDPSTALKIAFGRAYAAPEEPRVVGVFSDAVDLAAGQFVTPPGDQPLARTQLFAARTFGPPDMDGSAPSLTSSGVAMIVGDSERDSLAPIVVPLLTDGGNGAFSLAKVDLVAATRGHFVKADTGSDDLAVVARGTDGNDALWLFQRDATDGHLVGTQSQVSLTCDRCVLVAADVDGDGVDELVQLGGKALTVYAGSAAGFAMKSALNNLDHDFRSVLGSESAPMTSVLDARDHAPRPIVGSLDVPPDGGTDPVDIIARDVDGNLVAFWNKGDGTFGAPQVLLPAADCGMATCAQQSMARIRIGTSPEPTLVVAAPGKVTFYTLKARALEALDLKLSDSDVPQASADYVAVGAADLDGDGVDDLALLVSSSSIHFLRGNPVFE